MACANGHTEVVRRLLEAGADVDMKNAEENTPLHWACLNGHTDVVRALLEKKASPCALNMYVGADFQGSIGAHTVCATCKNTHVFIPAPHVTLLQPLSSCC
eukprot:238029-Chlamydomonas_euryale.AAC.13